MLLENAEQTAYFDPHQVLINFGFSHSTPVPFLGTGGVKAHEVSNALHESTHQDGMHSEMGLWYLHLFWKFMARVARPSADFFGAGSATRQPPTT